MSLLGRLCFVMPFCCKQVWARRPSSPDCCCFWFPCRSCCPSIVVGVAEVHHHDHALETRTTTGQSFRLVAEMFVASGVWEGRLWICHSWTRDILANDNCWNYLPPRHLPRHYYCCCCCCIGVVESPHYRHRCYSIVEDKDFPCGFQWKLWWERSIPHHCSYEGVS